MNKEYKNKNFIELIQPFIDSNYKIECIKPRYLSKFYMIVKKENNTIFVGSFNKLIDNIDYILSIKIS